MVITLNGTPQTLPDTVHTLHDLIHHLGLTPDHISILQNNQIVPNQSGSIAPNDCIEIMHFVGGGSPNH